MKYKKGQKVRIVSDSANYPHCIGKIGIIQNSADDDYDGSYHVVEVVFPFPLPEDYRRDTRSRYAREFYLEEIEAVTGEETVKTLLQKLKI